jgi:hypothetical protein
MVSSTVSSADLNHQPPADKDDEFGPDKLWPTDGLLSLLNAATIMNPRASSEDIGSMVLRQYGIVHIDRLRVELGRIRKALVQIDEELDDMSDQMDDGEE